MNEEVLNDLRQVVNCWRDVQWASSPPEHRIETTINILVRAIDKLIEAEIRALVEK